jgi:hypothetical protein
MDLPKPRESKMEKGINKKKKGEISLSEIINESVTSSDEL